MNNNDWNDAEDLYLAEREAEQDINFLLESAALSIHAAMDNTTEPTNYNINNLLENAQIYISKAINLLEKK